MIKCPYCGIVGCITTDTRNSTLGKVRRNKKCKSCGKLFTTYEVVMTDEEYRNDPKYRHDAFLRIGSGRKRDG